MSKLKRAYQANSQKYDPIILGIWLGVMSLVAIGILRLIGG